MTEDLSELIHAESYLTPIREVAPHRTPNGTKFRMIECSCKCGSGVGTYRLARLKNGTTKSCGCAVGDVARMRVSKFKSSLLRGIWLGMCNRCTNKENPDYPLYGAKGISVSGIFEDYFMFEEWALSSGYEEGLSIDRIDPKKGYHIDNCRIVPMSMQSRNRGMQSNNVSGYTGVYYSAGSWVSQWNDESGTKRTKSFNGLKYSNPKEMAIAYRELMLKTLISKDMGYTEHHGKR